MYKIMIYCNYQKREELYGKQVFESRYDGLVSLYLALDEKTKLNAFLEQRNLKN